MTREKLSYPLELTELADPRDRIVCDHCDGETRKWQLRNRCWALHVWMCVDCGWITNIQRDPLTQFGRPASVFYNE